jgi:hypothetical protein
MSGSRRWGRLAALLLVGAALALVGGKPATASVSLAVTWEGLLKESSDAVVVTPSDSRAAWENGRIYTYTHVHVDRAVAGALAAGAEVWIRTLGGVVGDIGQRVEGEASFARGQASLVFLHPGPPGAFEVTARAQGQFPVVVEDPKLPAHLVRHAALGMLLPRKGPALQSTRLATEVLHGRPLDDAALEVASDWDRLHTH